MPAASAWGAGISFSDGRARRTGTPGRLRRFLIQTEGSLRTTVARDILVRQFGGSTSCIDGRDSGHAQAAASGLIHTV
jgi:hypothetical protein